jgi:hypothetical protein
MRPSVPRPPNPLLKTFSTAVGKAVFLPLGRNRARVDFPEQRVLGGGFVMLRASAVVVRFSPSDDWRFERFDSVLSTGLMLRKALGRDGEAALCHEFLDALSEVLPGCEPSLLDVEILREKSVVNEADRKVAEIEEEISRRSRKLSVLKVHAERVRVESEARISALEAERDSLSTPAP